MSKDGWELIERDLREVFGFSKEERPQERAHAYITANEVLRGFDDTALEVAAKHMCLRSYELGRRDAIEQTPEAQLVAAELTEQAGRLLKCAAELRGVPGQDGAR